MSVMANSQRKVQRSLAYNRDQLLGMGKSAVRIARLYRTRQISGARELPARDIAAAWSHWMGAAETRRKTLLLLASKIQAAKRSNIRCCNS